MPKHTTHRKLNKMVLRKEFQEVNSWMDEPSKWLGKRHRRLRHDPTSVFLKYGASKRTLAGMLHILADTAFSENYGIKRNKKKYRERESRKNKKSGRKSS